VAHAAQQLAKIALQQIPADKAELFLSGEFGEIFFLE
jgi:hypothetical protein